MLENRKLNKLQQFRPTGKSFKSHQNCYYTHRSPADTCSENGNKCYIRRWIFKLTKIRLNSADLEFEILLELF